MSHTNHEASQTVMEFWADHRGKFEGAELEQFTAIASSPILAERMGHLVEFVYARMDKFSKAELGHLLPVAELATELQLGDFGDDQRGTRIIKMMKGQTVAQKDVPEPLGRFSPPSWTPEMPVAPGGPPEGAVVEDPQPEAAPQ